MKILVTGGSGFIGGHLIRRLTADGHDVVNVDTQSVNPIDIVDTQQLLDCFEEAKPDAVVHLAALKRGDAGEVYATNVYGTLNVVKASENAHVKRLVFSSTSALYGHSHQVEWEQCFPLSAYGRSKLIGEVLVRKSNIPSVLSLRFFNVYGEGGESVVNVIDNCLRTGDVFTVFNRGVMLRDFLSVDRIVDAICTSLMDETVTGVVNVGSGHGINVKGLVDLAETCGSLAYVVENQSKRIDTYDSVADTKLCASQLGLSVTKQEVEESLLKFWKR